MTLDAWLAHVGYVPGKWRIEIRDNGNEFSGPRLQYSVFGPGCAHTHIV